MPVACVLSELTPRENEIIGLIADHYLTNGQIAVELVLAEWTVDTHVHRSLRKLHVSSRQEASRLTGAPYCTYTASYPACSYYGAWSWYIYYQRNPDSWKSEQVNTWSGGPFWHRTGYF